MVPSIWKISWWFTPRIHSKNIPGAHNLGKLRHRPVGSCISSPESVTLWPVTRKLRCDALKHHRKLPKWLVHLQMAPAQGCSTNPDLRTFTLPIQKVVGRNATENSIKKTYWQPNCTCSMQTWHWEKMLSHLHNCTVTQFGNLAPTSELKFWLTLFLVTVKWHNFASTTKLTKYWSFTSQVSMLRYSTREIMKKLTCLKLPKFNKMQHGLSAVL